MALEYSAALQDVWDSHLCVSIVDGTSARRSAISPLTFMEDEEKELSDGNLTDIHLRHIPPSVEKYHRYSPSAPTHSSIQLPAPF